MSQIAEYVEKLSHLIPEFSERWESEDSYFNFGADSTIHGVFAEFSLIISTRLKSDTLENTEEIFSFIESEVIKGGDVAEAACTCFLENILNRTPQEINPKTFVPYLGPESKEYCKAWDDFTGVKTPGL